MICTKHRRLLVSLILGISTGVLTTSRTLSAQTETTSQESSAETERESSADAGVEGGASAGNKSSGALRGMGMGGMGGLEPLMFSFPGGTLEEYVKRVREFLPSDLVQFPPVTIDPAVKDSEIPPIEVASSHPNLLLELVSAFGDRKFVLNSNPGLPIRVYQFEKWPRETGVYGLQAILAGAADEDHNKKLMEVISAIEAALEVSSLSEPKANLKYHPETALLFVSAAPEQVQMVQQVINELASRHELVEKIDELNRYIEKLEKELRQHAYQEALRQRERGGEESDRP